MLTKWNGKLIAVSFLLNLTSLGLSHIKKGLLCSMVKSTWKSEFHPYAVFLTRAQWSVMLGENFSHSSINKAQLKDLQNYLNQKIIEAIDTVDGSTLGGNLIMSHQVDCMSSVLIPAEAVENDQEQITSCSNKVGSITPLV